MKNTFFVKHDSGFIFRIKGYGLCVNDRNKTPAPFSVRQRYRKELRVGRWGIQLLQPTSHVQ